MSAAPRVEVVIAVHNAARPVGRAVASVLEGSTDLSPEQVAVTVVCHHVPASEIAPGIAPQWHPRVRLLEHRDGLASPAGPFNAGMDAARGAFVSLLGSDDTLAPGAIASWLRLADRTDAECVITRLELQGATVPTPPVRPWPQRSRRHHLDPVADRLSYRSAPLGLVSVAALRRLQLRLPEGLAVGEDIPFVTRLWCETRVSFDRSGPAYRIGVDATDRVTYQDRPIAIELAGTRHTVEQEWFARYPLQLRRPVVTKLARIHLFGAVWHRRDPAWWSEQERADLAEVTRLLGHSAPGFADPLSRADHRLLRACADIAVPTAELCAAAVARRRHGRPSTLIPHRLGAALHPEAPLRFMAASLWAGRG